MPEKKILLYSKVISKAAKIATACFVCDTFRYGWRSLSAKSGAAPSVMNTIVQAKKMIDNLRSQSLIHNAFHHSYPLIIHSHG